MEEVFVESKRLGRWTLTALLAIGPAVAMGAATGSAGVDTPPEADMLHRMMVLAMQLGLILFAAKLVNILFQKIGLPGPLGELAAGVVIGPFALGSIPLVGFEHGLFHNPVYTGIAVTPELYGFASIAAIVLLFNVGLETNLKLLLRYAVVGGVVGLGGMLVSLALGAGCVVLFSDMLFGKQVSLLAPQCLFLGAITTATSVGITARILSDKKKLDCPESVTILSAAVIDDVLGIILLAIVMSLVTASKARVGGAVDWGRIGIVAVKALGVWLAATTAGLVAARRISSVLKWFGDRTAIAVLALGLALLVAGLFEEAGLAMIIGAYVMGLSLSKADISHVIQEKLHPIYILLVPVFFCVTGMQIDLGALGSPPVLLFGAVYAVAALASKVIGCGLPALLTSFNLRGAGRIGFGMAPRCEVALIIAGVGLSVKLSDGEPLLNSQLFAAVIIMVVVNTVVAPPALMALFRSDKAGTRKAVPTDQTEVQSDFELPSPEMAEFFVGHLQGVFEAEGFFFHLINQRQRLYELRKDRTLISLQIDESALRFSCIPSEASLVNAAMYEALAHLERAIRGLKQPLDAQSIQKRLQDGNSSAEQVFRLGDYLTPALVEPRLRGNSKSEVLDELLDILVRNGAVDDREAARKAILTREESLSTGLQYGVAIPHGRTSAVKKLVCAVGIKPDGIDFAAMDGQPSRIFVLTLSPDDRPAPHVQFMSTVSQVLTDQGRQRMLGCTTSEEIWAVFSGPRAAAKPTRRKSGRFELADYLRAELCLPDLQGATKGEVIAELLAALADGGHVRDVETASRVVLEREGQSSTGMEKGLAVPHGRTDAVDRLVCAVGVKPGGIDFGAMDGRPSSIFVLVLTPVAGADPYLQFVASLIAALDEDGRRRVLAARTPEQLRAALMA